MNWLLLLIIISLSIVALYNYTVHEVVCNFISSSFHRSKVDNDKAFSRQMWPAQHIHEDAIPAVLALEGEGHMTPLSHAA